MMGDTPNRRATRRNLARQPVQGRPSTAHQPKLSPLTPDELAYIIDRAREQRTEDDITAYETRRRTA